MKKSIIYTSLLITALFSAQEGRIIKVDKEMGLIYYADGSVYSTDESNINRKNVYTNNSQPTIIREIEDGQEVEYIIQNDNNKKIVEPPQPQYIETPPQPRWKPTIVQIQEPQIVEKEEYIIGKNIQSQPIIKPTTRHSNNKKQNIGKVHGRATVTYADNEKAKASVYYLETGYETPSYNGVSAKISHYIAGDTGLTDVPNKEIKTKTGLSETYIKYKGKNIKVQAGQFRLNTPLTKDKSSTISNMYKGAVASSSKLIKNSTVVGAYITEIKKGGIKPQASKSTKSRSYDDENIELFDLEDVDTNAQLGATLATNAVDKKKSDNIAIAGIINKSIKNSTIQVWEYYAFDVANVTYVDGMMKFKMANGVKTMVGAQLIHQSVEDQDGNPMLIGIKGAVGYKSGQIIVAINKSNGDVILNKWGGDPAYTSSAKSKNEYNKDVTAVKLIGKYNIPAFKNIIPKNLQLVVSQASYSKSSDGKSTRDAKETDIVLKYKPKKNLLFVAAYIDKTSDISDKQNIKLSKVAVKYKF